MRHDLGRGETLGARGAGTMAGLGPRAAAFALDYLPVAAYLALLVAVGAALGWAFPDAMARAFGQAARAQAIGFALVTLPVGLYFALSEASGRQATWGKRRLGLVVVGPCGAPLGLARSLARTGVKLVPWELAHAVVWGITLAGGRAHAGPSGAVGADVAAGGGERCGDRSVPAGGVRRGGGDEGRAGWCAGLTAGDFLASLRRHTAAIRRPSR